MPRKKKEEIETIAEEVQVRKDLIDVTTIDMSNDDYYKIKIEYTLPLQIKMAMVDDIINACSEINENGMFEINYKIKDMITNFIILRDFTNIDMSTMDAFDIYNYLYENGIIHCVMTDIKPEEINYIKTCVNQELRQKQELNNTIEAVVNRGIKELIAKIPDEKGMLKVAKQIQKFDPEKMEMVKSMMNTLQGKENKTEVTE